MKIRDENFVSIFFAILALFSLIFAALIVKSYDWRCGLTIRGIFS